MQLFVLEQRRCHLFVVVGDIEEIVIIKLPTSYTQGQLLTAVR